MGRPCACKVAPRPVVGRALRQVSPLRLLRFGQTVHNTLGLKLTLLVISIFFGLKGLLDSLLNETLLPYYQELKYDGVAYQRTLALALTPYAMKGFIGSTSDYFPIFGFHKKYYMLAANLVGMVSAVILVALPEEVAASSIVYVGLLFCGIHLHIATADLLCEGVYCKVIRSNPAVGAKLVAFVSFCNSAGHMVGKGLVGPISDAFGSAPLIYMCLPLTLQSLAPIACNFLGEVREEGCGELGAGKEKGRDKGVLYVALLTSLSACIAVVLTLQTWKGFAPLFTAGVVVVLGGAFWHLLSRQLALCAMFFFADKVLHLTIAGAVNLFYIAPPSCVPDGPHFDYTYFCTFSSFVGAIGCWFGIYAFQKWFKGWSARNVLWVANFVRIFAALFDYVIVKRLNVKLGVPDKLMFMMGDAIVYHLVLTLSLMTSSLTIARSCPPKLESTVYAIVSGVTNLGSTCSKMLGAVAIELAGIKMKETDPGGCDFSALPNLILASQCFLPIICIPLAYLMLPKEALNSAAAPTVKRSSKAGAAAGGPVALTGGGPQQAETSVEAQEEEREEDREAPSDGLSDALAIHGPDETEGEVVAGQVGTRPRIVERLVLFEVIGRRNRANVRLAVGPAGVRTPEFDRSVALTLSSSGNAFKFADFALGDFFAFAAVSFALFFPIPLSRAPAAWPMRNIPRPSLRADCTIVHGPP
ncbi:hypothetical protein Efla_004209 [Eimeria flavescens]